MKSNEEFKRKMLALLKSDYGIELWNVGGGFVRVSFYHLGSVYNALCSGFVGDDEPSVNWQYARPNKKAEKLVKWITQYIITYYSQNNNIDYIESEFDYFKKLSGAVFDAKYSTETALHVMNA